MSVLNPDLTLDHLLWAAPNLDSAINIFEQRTGVRPLYGGAHAGQGTRNALVALGRDIYLEVLAPDPAQKLEATLGAYLAAQPAEVLFTWAIKVPDLKAVAAKIESIQCVTARRVPMARALPQGGLLEWEVLMFEDHPFGRLVPFGIDPAETPKRIEAGAKGCTLEHFTIETPEPKELKTLFDQIGIAAKVVSGPVPRLIACLNTPSGEVELSSTDSVREQ